VSGTAPKQFNTKEAAQQAERDHVHLVLHPPADGGPKEEVPTVEKFHGEFMETYVSANNKPSERMAKEYMFKYHIVPWFGRYRLDAITTRDIEKFKAAKLAAHEQTGKKLAPKTVNNFLTCLGRMLRYAVECEIIEKLPRVKFVKVMPQEIDFLEHAEAERLVEASKHDPKAHAAILLGLDAGLRIGEIRSLEWGDLDLVAGIVNVQRTEYRGHVGSPKGGRRRKIPLTRRAVAALKAIRHLMGPPVFCVMDEATGQPRRWRPREVDRWVRHGYKRAGLREIGWHTLRHTFCSELAARNVPLRTIQELAGHATITTTQRYLHGTPMAARNAIAILERPAGQEVAKSEGAMQKTE
jgi:integrase